MGLSIGEERIAGAATATITNSMGDVTNASFATMDGAQKYVSKLFEFARANTDSLFEHLEKVSNAKSPGELVEMTRERLERGMEALYRQANELIVITQRATIIAM